MTSCSLTSPRDVGKANMITLSPLNEVKQSNKKLSNITIAYPLVPSELDTYRIAVIRADKREDYFASVRWSEFLPAIIESNLKQTIANSKIFSQVQNDDKKSASDYILMTTVNDMKAIYYSDKKPPEIYINISFALKKGKNNLLIKEFNIQKTIGLSENNISSIARGFDKAFLLIQKELIEDISKNIKF